MQVCMSNWNTNIAFKVTVVIHYHLDLFHTLKSQMGVIGKIDIQLLKHFFLSASP